jgi:hypothetical protein
MAWAAATANFFSGFHDPPFEKRFLFRLEPVAQFEQAGRMGVWKRAGHQEARDALFFQHRMDDVGRAGIVRAGSPDLPFPFRVRQDLLHRRLAPGPVHFQVAHDEETFTLGLQEDEGVRGYEPRGVVEV